MPYPRPLVHLPLHPLIALTYCPILSYPLSHHYIRVVPYSPVSRCRLIFVSHVYLNPNRNQQIITVTPTPTISRVYLHLFYSLTITVTMHIIQANRFLFMCHFAITIFMNLTLAPTRLLFLIHLGIKRQWVPYRHVNCSLEVI